MAFQLGISMPFPHGLYLTECIAAGEYIISVSALCHILIFATLLSTWLQQMLQTCCLGHSMSTSVGDSLDQKIKNCYPSLLEENRALEIPEMFKKA